MNCLADCLPNNCLLPLRNELLRGRGVGAVGEEGRRILVVDRHQHISENVCILSERWRGIRGWAEISKTFLSFVMSSFALEDIDFEISLIIVTRQRGIFHIRLQSQPIDC